MALTIHDDGHVDVGQLDQAFSTGAWRRGRIERPAISLEQYRQAQVGRPRSDLMGLTIDHDTESFSFKIPHVPGGE